MKSISPPSVEVMAFDSIEIGALTILGFLGLVGGIPQLLKWITPKPHLKINDATINRIPNENHKFHLQLEVENERKSWKRNCDASDLVYEFYIMDKESIQRGSASGQTVAQHLLAGFKIKKEAEVFLSLPPEGNPYTVLFRIVCREGNVVTKIMALEAPPIEYS